MESNIDKLHRVYEKYKDRIESFFHTFLWRILVDETFKGRTYAIVAVLQEGGFYRIGIAEQNVPGYTPTAAIIDNPEMTYDDIEDMMDELNYDLLGLSPEQSNKIVLSSMLKPIRLENQEN